MESDDAEALLSLLLHCTVSDTVSPPCSSLSSLHAAEEED